MSPFIIIKYYGGYHSELENQHEFRPKLRLLQDQGTRYRSHAYSWRTLK